MRTCSLFHFGSEPAAGPPIGGFFGSELLLEHLLHGLGDGPARSHRRSCAPAAAATSPGFRPRPSPVPRTVRFPRASQSSTPIAPAAEQERSRARDGIFRTEIARASSRAPLPTPPPRNRSRERRVTSVRGRDAGDSSRLRPTRRALGWRRCARARESAGSVPTLPAPRTPTEIRAPSMIGSHSA
jgi:hypothetical protein